MKVPRSIVQGLTLMCHGREDNLAVGLGSRTFIFHASYTKNAPSQAAE